MKHYGDSSQPDPKERFMADSDSISIDDTDDDVKSHLDSVDIPEHQEKKAYRTSGTTWDADVVPE